MAKRRRRSTRKKPLPGWIWMMFGLSIGLVVAAGVYVRGPQAGRPSVDAAPSEVKSEPRSPAPQASAGQTEEPQSDDEMHFDFYELLPNFEVVVPEIETAVTPGPGAAAVSEPGVYVVQAGSFRRLQDADRRQANLALLGVESTIQNVTVDSTTYFRVRIGPTADLTELNGIRRRLINAKIETLLIKLPK